MNKTEFIDLLAEELNYSKAQAGKVLDSMLKCVSKALTMDDILRFVGFGTFKIKKTKARKVTTPRGKVVSVPAQNQIRFSAGETLKQELNK